MPNPPAPADLGFIGNETSGWTKVLRGCNARFRILRTLDELTDAEFLQTDVFQVSERDLLSNISLLSAAETGGAVLAAYLAEEPDRPVGVLIGWGGFTLPIPATLDRSPVNWINRRFIELIAMAM